MPLPHVVAVISKHPGGHRRIGRYFSGAPTELEVSDADLALLRADERIAVVPLRRPAETPAAGDQESESEAPPEAGRRGGKRGRAEAEG